jgi:hypothetical protein
MPQNVNWMASRTIRRRQVTAGARSTNRNAWPMEAGEQTDDGHDRDPI